MMHAQSAALVLLLGSPVPAQQLFVETRKEALPHSTGDTLMLHAGDLDSDGNVDLAIGNGILSRLLTDTFLFGDGKGRFRRRSPEAHAKLVHALTDLDGDGALDAVYEHGVLRNDGTGQFTERPFGPPNNPPLLARAAVGDIDGDGASDVVARVVYRNLGGLSFAPLPGTNLPPLGTPVLADVDGDGDPDLLDHGLDPYTPPRLFTNNGTGVFAETTGTNLPGGSPAVSVLAAADGDGDGDLDLFLGADRVLYWENNGQGVFADQSAVVQGPTSITVHDLAVADLDGDGRVDIVVGTEGGGTVMWGTTSGLWLRRSFPGNSSTFLNGRRTRALLTTDLDGDGDLDVVQGASRLLLPYSGWYGSENRVFLQMGPFEFVDPQPPMLPNLANDQEGVLADVTGDGLLDLVLGHDGGGVLPGDGRGGFEQPRPWGLPVGGEPFPGDLDGDGDLDVVLRDQAAGVFHVLTNSGGQFRITISHWLPFPSSHLSALCLGDFDGDGDLDVFGGTGRVTPVGSCPPSDVLWHNDGRGNFSLTSGLLPAVATCATDAAAGDLDGDGDLDIVLQEERVYFQDPGGVFRVGPVASSWFSRGQVVLTDLDGDGDLDAASANGCRFNITPGCGVGEGHWNTYRLNDGTGDLSDLHFFDDTNLTYSTSLAVGDLDADRLPDVVIGNEQDNRATDDVLLNTGITGPSALFRNVTFGSSVAVRALPQEWEDPNNVLLGDLDQDGDLDLVTLNQSQPGGAYPRSKVHHNLTVHLRAPYNARLGFSYVLESWGAGAGAWLYASLGTGSMAVPGLGVFALDPLATTFARSLPPSPAGAPAVTSLPVPPVPALVGVTVHWQALMFGTPLGGIRISNPVSDTLVLW